MICTGTVFRPWLALFIFVQFLLPVHCVGEGSEYSNAFDALRFHPAKRSFYSGPDGYEKQWLQCMQELQELKRNYESDSEEEYSATPAPESEEDEDSYEKNYPPNYAPAFHYENLHISDVIYPLKLRKVPTYPRQMTSYAPMGRGTSEGGGYGKKKEIQKFGMEMSQGYGSQKPALAHQQQKYHDGKKGQKSTGQKEYAVNGRHENSIGKEQPKTKKKEDLPKHTEKKEASYESAEKEAYESVEEANEEPVQQTEQHDDYNQKESQHGSSEEEHGAGNGEINEEEAAVEEEYSKEGEQDESASFDNLNISDEPYASTEAADEEEAEEKEESYQKEEESVEEEEDQGNGADDVEEQRSHEEEQGEEEEEKEEEDVADQQQQSSEEKEKEQDNIEADDDDNQQQEEEEAEKEQMESGESSSREEFPANHEAAGSHPPAVPPPPPSVHEQMPEQQPAQPQMPQQPAQPPQIPAQPQPPPPQAIQQPAEQSQVEANPTAQQQQQQQLPSLPQIPAPIPANNQSQPAPPAANTPCRFVPLELCSARARCPTDRGQGQTDCTMQGDDLVFDQATQDCKSIGGIPECQKEAYCSGKPLGWTPVGGQCTKVAYMCSVPNAATNAGGGQMICQGADVMNPASPPQCIPRATVPGC